MLQPSSAATWWRLQPTLSSLAEGSLSSFHSVVVWVLYKRYHVSSWLILLRFSSFSSSWLLPVASLWFSGRRSEKRSLVEWRVLYRKIMEFTLTKRTIDTSQRLGIMHKNICTAVQCAPRAGTLTVVLNGTRFSPVFLNLKSHSCPSPAVFEINMAILLTRTSVKLGYLDRQANKMETPMKLFIIWGVIMRERSTFGGSPLIWPV